MAPLFADRLRPFMVPNRVMVSPSNREEWENVLKSVKALYLQRHYKKCASRSTEILNGAKDPIHPIYKLYLFYYRAISYEILGRSAHNYSSNKIPMLNWARDDYIACTRSIPELLAIPRVDIAGYSTENSTSPSGSSFSENPSTTGTSVIYPTRTEEKDMDKCRALDLEALLSIESISGEDLISEWAKKSSCQDATGEEEYYPSLMPSPLRIRKSRCTVPADATPTKIPRPLPQLPVKLNTAPPRSATNKKHKPTRAISVSRYNVIVLSFSTQLNRNIKSVSSLVTLTRKLQRAHQATRNARLASFWLLKQEDTDGAEKKDESPRYSGSSMLPDPFLTAGTTDECKEQRIVRLRNEGWNTVGLKSKARGWKGKEYYERFCSQAMAELYEDEQVEFSDTEQAFL